MVLIGAEPERPYERPPLSKDYLRGEAGRDKVYVHDEGFYAEHDIELRLGRTVGEHRPGGAAQLALDDGERLRFDRLLLATGAEPRRLAIAGRRARRRALPAQRRRTPTRCASGSTAAVRSS